MTTAPTPSVTQPAGPASVDDLQSQIDMLSRVSTRLLSDNSSPEAAVEAQTLAAIRDRLILSVVQDKSDDADRYYLADYSHANYDGLVMWWRADGKGYTNDLDQAGIYKKAQVLQLQRKNTVPVPVAMLKTFRIRKAVSVGDALNHSFSDPDALRAAVARFESWDPRTRLAAEKQTGIIPAETPKPATPAAAAPAPVAGRPKWGALR